MDRQQRELARKAAQGDVESAAKLLLERVRSGTLDRERLLLAGYLGDESAVSAIAALGEEAPTLADYLTDPGATATQHGYADEVPRESVELETFIRSLSHWGWEALVRASLACAHLQVVTHSPVPLARDALQSAEAFVGDPNERSREKAQKIAEQATSLYERIAGENPDTPEARGIWYDLGAPWFAAEAAASDYAHHEWDHGTSWRDSTSWKYRNTVWPSRAADAAAHWTSTSRVRAAVAQDLITWVLSTPSG